MVRLALSQHINSELSYYYLHGRSLHHQPPLVEAKLHSPCACNTAAQGLRPATQGAPPQSNQAGDSQPAHSFPTGLSSPPPIIPRPADIRPSVNVPMPKGVEKLEANPLTERQDGVQ